jgi:predicted phage-related endonuclease
MIHDLVQGSPEWDAFRLEHHGASEAGAMLGLSPVMTRTELLKMKKLGLPREFSQFVQERVLDRGHETEALARPLIEQIIGEELYASTHSMGRLSASCDGLTIDDETAMEHKQWSERLAAIVREGLVPEEHMPQCQQVLMVTKAKRLIFVVSDGTPERMVHVWVKPDAEWFARIRDGWAQFDRDLAAYVLPESAAPAPVGKAPDLLPALRIEVTGAVTASNLAEFKATALATIRAVNRTLKTDQDFADADKAVKWCADVEGRLKAAKEHALSQTADIEALFRALDEIGAEAKTVRLDLDKLVTRRKTEVKEEAVSKARRALDEHVASLNAEIAPMRVTVGPVDFAGAIKGLRSIASMQDALDTALAGGRIAADTAARVVRGNVATFQAEAAGFEFLFADLGALVHKAADDFKAVVSSRIATHKAAEAAREAKRQADALAAQQAESARLEALAVSNRARLAA